MKKNILIVLAVLILTSTAFAGGNSGRENRFNPGEHYEEMQKLFDNAEIETVEGTLSFDKTRVVLKSKDKTYGLKVPGINQYVWDLDLEDGEPLKVTGYLFNSEDLPFEPFDDYDGHLMAEEIEIGGKIYVLPARGSGFRQGRGPGMSGGPGGGPGGFGCESGGFMGGGRGLYRDNDTRGKR